MPVWSGNNPGGSLPAGNNAIWLFIALGYIEHRGVFARGGNVGEVNGGPTVRMRDVTDGL